MQQLDFFTSAAIPNVNPLAAFDCDFSDDELRVMLQSAIYVSRSAVPAEYFHYADELDDLVIASKYSRDSHVVALRDLAIEAIKTLNQQVDDFKAEIKRGLDWSMVRSLSYIHAEISSPFKASARVIRGRAYRGADEDQSEG